MTSSSRSQQHRRVAVTAALALAYLVALAATGVLSGRHVLPLFEGIGPLPPYRWVNPPPEFAAGNQPPSAFDATIALDASGSVSTSGLATPDGQVVLNLASGAIATSPGATAVAVHIEPLAPAKLATVPSPLRADGNAYRITMTYQPGGGSVQSLAKPGNVFLIVPEPAETMLSSSDGAVWNRLGSNAVAATGSVAAPLDAPGFFVAATSTASGSPSTSSSSWNTIIVVALTAVLGLVIVLSPAAYRRLRPTPVRASRSKRPPVKRSPAKRPPAPARRRSGQGSKRKRR